MAEVPGDAAPLPEDAVEVGRVLGAHGIRGGLKVVAFSAQPEALFSARRWFVTPPEPPGLLPDGVPPRRPTEAVRIRVLEAREQPDAVVARWEGVEDRDHAAALRGCRVWVPRSGFPSTEPDEFYWVDLIGLAVHNRQGLLLGSVRGLLETGAHCVLRIGPADPAMAVPAAEETLIPFVDAYVDAVDLPGRRITVDWQTDY